jgi:hypothetical protein
MEVAERQSRLWWAAVGAATLAGLALRIAAARGGLWTDEAWSVIYAARAHDAAGVFLRINHDNNHHLYSLWLQAIGPHASPMLARLPAIVAGTLCVPLAAMVVARRSAWAGVVAAVLFAVSPTMVNFGSEARGYSLMLLAALGFLWLAAEAVEGRERRGTPWSLGLVALLGMLSHMTMAAPVALVGLWLYLERRAAVGPAKAMRDSIRLMAPAFVATASVVAFVFAAAAVSPTGMQLGGYLPFAWRDFFAGLNDMTGWTASLSFLHDWVVPLLLGAAALWVGLRPPKWLDGRGRLYAILILGVPVGAALVQSGNSGFARYYLASAIGLLLLTSEWIARGFDKRPMVKLAAASLLAVLTLTALWRDSELIQLQRGEPDQAVALMAQQAPLGARVALDPKRLEGALTVAAEQAGYPVAIAKGCADADFVLAAQRRWEPTPAAIDHCGIAMRAVGSSVVTTLTGEAWVLYGAQRLQTAGAPVSGRPPAASDRRLSGRAGVAQG